MLRSVLALGLTLAWLAPQTGPPPMPFVDEGACPFECCTYRDWTASAPVPIYDDWAWKSLRPGAPHKILFRVAKGEVVTALTGVVVTTRPGRVRFSKAATTEAFSRRFPSAPAEVISFQPGDVLYLLTPRGEGAFAAWFKGRLLEELDTGPLLQAGEWPGEKRVSQWWVRIRDAKGQVGWTDRPGDFSNKDACGG